MEFNSGTLLIFLAVCVIARAILFHRSGIKWWKSFVPIYNKYLLGKMTGHKLIGSLNAFFLPFTYIFTLGYYALSLSIVQQYDPQFKIMADGSYTMSDAVMVPESLALKMNILNYVFIAVLLMAIILWDIMMWKLIVYEKKNPWWIVAWTICPVLPYVVFALSTMWTINGETYKLEKVKVTPKPATNTSTNVTLLNSNTKKRSRNRKKRKK